MMIEWYNRTRFYYGNYVQKDYSMVEMEDKNMDEAKMIWRLSNGELVEIEDRVQVTTSDDEVYVGNIIDIGETYITIEIDYKTGEELDIFFSELKDVRLVKQLQNDCFIEYERRIRL